MPKVSVIIPVYNVEKYLRECLDSVVNQTLKDIEIICINDGSTDNSLQILEEYTQKDNRIKIIDKKNEGVGKARNDGIKKAQGEFVCFIDPDDIYPTTDILETLYDGATQNQVLISGGEFSCFTNEKREYIQDYSESLAGYLFPENKIIEYKDYQFDYGYTRFIYNKKFLIDNNIFFPNYKRFQDPPFFVNAMIKAKRFYGIHKITYAYRRAHKNVNWNYIRIRDLLNGINDNFKYAKENNLLNLEQYTYRHFVDHYHFIKSNLNFYHQLQIYKMKFSSELMKEFISKENLNLLLSFAREIFSVRNDSKKTHKVITIFRIKIKLRRDNI